MKVLSFKNDLSFKVNNVSDIFCMEGSKNKEILYIGPNLIPKKVKGNCPVMICKAQDLKLIS
jgi:hypothetical protein